MRIPFEELPGPDDYLPEPIDLMESDDLYFTYEAHPYAGVYIDDLIPDVNSMDSETYDAWMDAINGVDVNTMIRMEFAYNFCKGFPTEFLRDYTLTEVFAGNVRIEVEGGVADQTRGWPVEIVDWDNEIREWDAEEED